MGRSTAPVTMMTFGVAMMLDFVFLTVQYLNLWLMFWILELEIKIGAGAVVRLSR
jgi:hypothetical protein